MTTTNKIITIWKVLLRNPDGETAKLEIENAASEMDAKIKAIDEYARTGWYATEAVLITSKPYGR